MSQIPAVSPFQVEVAQAFFQLPESKTFLLEGGLALLAQGLTSRPTSDLDAFTSEAADVQRAHQAFTQLCRLRGWHVRTLHSTDTFVRLHVSGSEELLIDLALDASPCQTPTMSFIGPTFSLDELAARKLLALFDRAMPRDFVDVYALTRDRMPDALLQNAREIDPGIDVTNLLLALRQLEHYRDEDLPALGAEIPAIREFFASWVETLTT